MILRQWSTRHSSKRWCSCQAVLPPSIWEWPLYSGRGLLWVWKVNEAPSTHLGRTNNNQTDETRLKERFFVDILVRTWIILIQPFDLIVVSPPRTRLQVMARYYSNCLILIAMDYRHAEGELKTNPLNSPPSIKPDSAEQLLFAPPANTSLSISLPFNNYYCDWLRAVCVKVQ